jgi:hypothetical protein
MTVSYSAHRDCSDPTSKGAYPAVCVDAATVTADPFGIDEAAPPRRSDVAWRREQSVRTCESV